MSGSAETLWRNGLKARGVDWVKAELRRRPGQPDDLVYDVVFQQPYPTREFCEKWCVEEDNAFFHMSGRSIAIIAGLVLLIVFVARAYVSWPKLAAPPTQNSAGMMQAPRPPASRHTSTPPGSRPIN